ncbi:MAG: hypothetical protein WB392_12980 [Methanotrichaceae archaeon]
MIAIAVVGTDIEKASGNKKLSKFNIFVLIAVILFLTALVLLLMYPGVSTWIFYFVTSIPIIVIFIHYYIKRKI